MWCYLGRWSTLLGGTGALGNEDDLAGLVCNKLGNDDCINPKRGSEEGITWADRLDSLNKKQNELDL